MIIIIIVPQSFIDVRARANAEIRAILFFTKQAYTNGVTSSPSS